MLRLKKVLIYVLCTILLLNNTMISFAGMDANAGGQNNTSSAATGKGNGSFKIPANTGYRFTITDNQGNVVSKINGQLGSLDVYNVGVNMNPKVSVLIGGCATDKDVDYFLPMEYDVFLNILNATNTPMPYWVDSSERLYGNEVKQWVLNKTSISQDSGSLSNSFIAPKTGSGASGTGGKNTSNTTTSNTKANQAESIQKLNNYIGLVPDFSDYKTLNDYLKKLETYYSSRKSVISVYVKDGDITAAQGKELLSRLNDYYQMSMHEAYQYKFSSNILSNLFTMTSYASNVSNVSPESGKGFQASESPNGGSAVSGNYDPQKEGYGWAIINMVDKNNNYVFVLPGSATSYSDSDMANGIRPGDIFIKNDYRLVVENTIQGRPQNYANGSPGASYPTLVYGTAHNWAIFGVTKWIPWGGGQTFGNHQRYLSRMLPRALVTERDWSGVLGTPPDDAQWTIDEMISRYNTGYGTHVYSPGDLGIASSNSIRTWDKANYPDETGPTEVPLAIDEAKDYIDKNINNTLNITKYYQFKDENGRIYPIEYYNTKNAPHTVYIMDEIYGGSGFKLIDWFESKQDFQPPEGGDVDDYSYSSVKKKYYDTGITGTTEELPHVIPADTQTKTLHILLEFTLIETQEVEVVKVYEDENGDVEKVTAPEKLPEGTTGYTVPDEAEYQYTDSKKTPNYPVPNIDDWDDTEGTPEGAVPAIKIDENTHTIYILYQKGKTKQLILYSNELSYTYDLRDLIESRQLFEIYDMAPKSPGYSPDCVLHSCGGSGKNCPHYRRCSLGRHTLTDQTFGLSVANNYNYNSETTFIKDYNYTSAGNASNSKTWFAQVNRSTIPVNTNRVKPNGDFLLYRQKDKDLVTLYPEKNDGLLSKLNGLGITSVAYSPSGTRVEKEMEKDKSFTNHFQTYFDYISHDMNLSWKWPRSKCNKNHGGSYSSSVVTTPAMANDYYSKNPQNVKQWYFVGKANQGMNDALKDTRDASFGNTFKWNQGFQYTSAELKFYPYAKMIYRAKNDNSNMQPVYVTSENLSTMKVFNAVQTGVYKKNNVNANLSSTQWSTHARSLSFLQNHGISDKKSVLPGGAIQDIDMGNSSDTKISVRIWQTCLPDENVAKVQDGFKVSVSEAKSAANALKSDIINILQGYGLVQWCMEGVTTDFEEILKSGEELHENTDIDFVLGNGGKTASDEKYYLRHDGSGSNRANFDVLGSRIDKQVLYTIKSDTEGNVWVEKDGTELGRIGMTQSASDLCKKNSEIALLDDNTKLVTNYISAIDRNKGENNKYDRYNRNKYNEAFDGISVLVTDISFDLGFSANNAHRTNVLDPLLTAKANSKSDLYNFSEDSNVRSSIYVTTTKSSTTNDGGSGYIGTLKGVSGIGDLEIGLNDIYKLVYTKIFYIPNATVNDLN